MAYTVEQLLTIPFNYIDTSFKQHPITFLEGPNTLTYLMMLYIAQNNDYLAFVTPPGTNGSKSEWTDKYMLKLANFIYLIAIINFLRTNTDFKDNETVACLGQTSLFCHERDTKYTINKVADRFHGLFITLTKQQLRTLEKHFDHLLEKYVLPILKAYIEKYGFYAKRYGIEINEAEFINIFRDGKLKMAKEQRFDQNTMRKATLKGKNLPQVVQGYADLMPSLPSDSIAALLYIDMANHGIETNIDIHSSNSKLKKTYSVGGFTADRFAVIPIFPVGVINNFEMMVSSTVICRYCFTEDSKRKSSSHFDTIADSQELFTTYQSQLQFYPIFYQALDLFKLTNTRSPNSSSFATSPEKRRLSTGIAASLASLAAPTVTHAGAAAAYKQLQLSTVAGELDPTSYNLSELKIPINMEINSWPNIEEIKKLFKVFGTPTAHVTADGSGCKCEIM